MMACSLQLGQTSICRRGEDLSRSPFEQVILTSCATDVLAVLIALALAFPFARRWRIGPGLGLVAYVVADDVIGLTPLLAGWNPGQWNWIGHSASIAFALLVTAIFLNREEVGLCWPRGRAALLWSGVGILVAASISAVDNLMSDASMPTAETFAFEAILPGPAEEFVFRGVGLALLVRMFRGSEVDRRAVVLAATTTAIWFTAGHVMQLSGTTFVFSSRRIIDVLPMGLMFAFVRIRSGSLLGGVLAHNIANVIAEAIGAMRA